MLSLVKVDQYSYPGRYEGLTIARSWSLPWAYSGSASWDASLDESSPRAAEGLPCGGGQ